MNYDNTDNNHIKLKGFNLSWLSRYRDELFGIAILSIMFFHFGLLHVDYYEGSQALTYNFVRWFKEYISNVGVEMFVFLSGMGLYYSFSKNNDIKGFYRRRFQRILIPYVIAGGTHRIVTDLVYMHTGLKRMLLDFSFVSFFTEGINNFWFILFIGAMYLVFPFIYKAVFDPRYGSIMFVVLLLISLAIPAVMYEHSRELYHNINVAVTRAPMFVIGTYAGKNIKEGRTVPHIAAAVIIALGVFCKYYDRLVDMNGYLSRYMCGMLGFSALFLCAYLIRILDDAKHFRGFLRFFGRYSLEFYLLHIMLWGILGGMGVPLHRASRYFIMICAACVLAPVLSRITEEITIKMNQNMNEHKALTKKGSI